MRHGNSGRIAASGLRERNRDHQKKSVARERGPLPEWADNRTSLLQCYNYLQCVQWEVISFQHVSLATNVRGALCHMLHVAEAGTGDCAEDRTSSNGS
jgi:hypothetical protein